ncbi:Zn-ribbon domain-containing OB-fold protein [Haloterrigena alkaliphila]|uniref:Zn-ribbon domain-containing OB-fold protein n=1 Tax=Haloterrigena alkaliphila TaxID=2816475 RepID=A0A8A2VAC5_9EURY|nr:Zn-ribbon domain-containing OB-fold protein [Haloterrigena alkaliphila]QSW97670.1 Zn-ribbon domain-containing OB-fold protein [Haloterrigena alkaliphila]
MSDTTDSNGGEGERERVSVPKEIELPRLLDFYELQTEDHTKIHEFYDNLRDGRLTTTQCTDCDAVHYPPRIVCPECTGDDLEYVDLPHEGELFAFSEVRGGLPMGLAEHDVPFVVGVVDLGPVQLSARIDDASYSDLEIGDPVSLKIVEIDGPVDEERVFYRFEPTDVDEGDSR